MNKKALHFFTFRETGDNFYQNRMQMHPYSHLVLHIMKEKG